MDQTTIDYLRGRVVSAVPVVSGDITTHTTISFDNGMVVEGCAMRSIASYNKEESDNAAFLDAIAKLSPGIEFMLNKTT
jgi:hypothetical protein